MNIRKAESKDTKQILEMLSQVLEVHVKIRPDIFISGTTKYSEEDLQKMIEDKDNYIYVAVDENDIVIAYAFCELQIPKFRITNGNPRLFNCRDESEPK